MDETFTKNRNLLIESHGIRGAGLKVCERRCSLLLHPFIAEMLNRFEFDRKAASTLLKK